MKLIIILSIVIIISYLSIGCFTAYAMSRGDGARPEIIEIIKFILTWPRLIV